MLTANLLAPWRMHPSLLHVSYQAIPCASPSVVPDSSPPHPSLLNPPAKQAKALADPDAAVAAALDAWTKFAAIPAGESPSSMVVKCVRRRRMTAIPLPRKASSRRGPPTWPSFHVDS